ncbi:MAG: ABC transporter ATP-binding protein [Pirellulales bacterium]|nr:ABC transporter ATP-binding protein [Pirellulales bacterium]
MTAAIQYEFSDLPMEWQKAARETLDPTEPILAWLEVDLTSALLFAPSLLVLTPRRIVCLSQAENNQEFALPPELQILLTEQKSVCRLELLSPAGRQVAWYFTVGKQTAAIRFVERVREVINGSAPRTAQPTICPSCGAMINSANGVCTACAPAAPPSAYSSLWRLLKFARPRRGMIILGLTLTLASTAIGLLAPLITRVLVDQVLIPQQVPSPPPPNYALLWWCLGGLAAVGVVAWGLDWARTWTLVWVSERVAADMRSRTFAHLQTLSVEFFGGKRTGDLMARIGSDSDRICNFLSLNLVDFIVDVLAIIMTAGILLWLNWQLALVTLLPFPLIIWLTHSVRAKLRRGFRQSGVSWGEMTSVLADTIPGIRVVKAFAQEQREVERFDAANQQVLDTNDRVNVVWSFFGPLVRLLTQFGLFIVWGVGAWLIFRHELTYGDLQAFITYILGFYGRSESIIMMVNAVQRAGASAQRIFEILDRVPSVAEPLRPVHPGRLQGHVELREVRFKYGTREVLHGINLTIEPGEMIGLVGPSGAGKSTLVNLICRFYDVSEGAILIDGHDVRSFPVAEYRHNIGIVLQDPFLFYGTIAENIAYGKPNATRAEIITAARLANAHEFILRLSDGYDSLVGERGQSLSGGERQRISIARALLIDPRLLILDEATSAVDTETERQIQQALETLTQGRTTIAIAHRLSTLRRANRLVVVEKGNIVEIGTHEQLLTRRGAYYNLVMAQQQMQQTLGLQS